MPIFLFILITTPPVGLCAFVLSPRAEFSKLWFRSPWIPIGITVGAELLLLGLVKLITIVVFN